jgi:hypothetical protein
MKTTKKNWEIFEGFRQKPGGNKEKGEFFLRVRNKIAKFAGWKWTSI